MSAEGVQSLGIKNVVNNFMHSFNTYICSHFFINWNMHVRLHLRKWQGFASVSADYFRYLLSVIYFPSGLFSVFRQSEENFQSLSKFGHSTEGIYFGTCLHLGNSVNRFLQLDQYDNYTLFRFPMLGGGWGPYGYQFQFT